MSKTEFGEHGQLDVPTEAHDHRAISAELINAVMSLMPDAVVVADGDGQVVSANDRAETLFGYSEGSLAGRAIETLVPERFRRRHRENRTAYLATPTTRPMGVGLDLTGRRQDGSEFPVDISLAPIEGDGERLVVAAVRDMTEQRQATGAQAQLAAIVSSSMDAIISTRLDGMISNWNPAATTLFGFEPAEILDRHVTVLVPEDQASVLERLLEDATTERRRSSLDTEWLHRTGERIDVAVSTSPLFEHGGFHSGFSFIVRDIRERKASEQKLHRLLADEEQLLRQDAATAEIRVALLAGTPIAESLGLICKVASEMIEAPTAVICVREPQGVRVQAAVGPAAEMIGTLLPPGLSFAEHVIDSAQSLEIDRRTDLSGVEVPDELPDGPTFGTPIIVGGAAVGALTFIQEPGSGEFRPALRSFAETLAAQASLAFELERAKEDTERLLVAGDRERIARDLHDLVIQEIFATGISLQGTMPRISDPRAQRNVSDAVEALDGVIKQIRTTIFSLSRKEGTEEGGLRGEVLDVVESLRDVLGFSPPVTFEGPLDTDVPDTILPEMLACLRESLTNVGRHANASSARVSVSIKDEMLVLRVTDDGQGFGDPGRLSGLANMEERAELLGGAMRKVSNQMGTLIEWRVPID